MKKTFLFFVFVVLGTLFSYSQTTTDSILVIKGFGGSYFVRDGKTLSLRDMKSIMTTDQEAFKQIKSAKANATAGYVLAFAGGFLVGWEIGTMLRGADMNVPVLGAGVGLVTTGIVLSKRAEKKAIKAVDIYNARLKTTSFWDAHSLDLGFCPNGIGVTFSF